MTSASEKTNNATLSAPILSAYYVTLLLIGAASYVGMGRIWGINIWHGQPTAVFVLLLVLGIIAPLVLPRMVAQTNDRLSNIILILFSIVLAVAFFLFPARTHFGGDGYQLLSRLADQVGSPKSWDIGVTIVNNAVFSALSGTNEARALSAYRLISGICGSVLILFTVLVSFRLYDSNRARLLLILGLLTGGYMLQFFGYVENYAGLMGAIALFCLIGVGATRKRINRFWSIISFAVALFFHGFAIVLLPGLLYLLFHDSSSYKKIMPHTNKSRWLLAVVVLIIGLGLHQYLYHSTLFFKFAFLPLLPDRFTVDNDFLLSLKHIADTLNLIFLQFPGFLILLVVLFSWRKKKQSRSFIFLATLLVTSLIAVYMFNPGIGMSRNWDLFSIVGPPLVLLAYLVILENDASDKKRHATATLMIALSLLSLVPRVVALNQPEIAIARFKNNIELDRVRNRYARTLLITYYEKKGDSTAAEKERQLTLREFPEEANVGRAKSLVQARRHQEAITFLRSVLKANPINYHAYTNLGAAFREMKQVDSAMFYLEIANGLNPYSKSILANLAAAYLDAQRFDDAVTTFEESFALGNDETIWHYYAAQAYRATGDNSGFERELQIAATRPDSPPYVMNELGDFYLSQQDYTKALNAYRTAIARGMDSTYLRQLIERYPALKQ